MELSDKTKQKLEEIIRNSTYKVEYLYVPIKPIPAEDIQIEKIKRSGGQIEFHVRVRRYYKKWFGLKKIKTDYFDLVSIPTHFIRPYNCSVFYNEEEAQIFAAGLIEGKILNI